MNEAAEWTCRSMRPSEIPAFSQLAQQSFLASVAPETSEQGVQHFLELSSIQALLERWPEDNGFYLCWKNDVLAGVLEVRGSSHIKLLFVHPEHQRQGVGKRLLAVAREHCSKEPQVTVNSAPSAIEFYRAQGFVPTAEEQEQNGLHFTPMTLKLDS